MNNRIKYHFDEHLPNAIAKAVRQYGIDVTMPIDVGLLQASDRTHLDYARRTGRVMVTYDLDYVRLHRMQVEHAGIAFILPRSRTIGRLIENLCLFYEFYSSDELINRLEYL